MVELSIFVDEFTLHSLMKQMGIFFLLSNLYISPLLYDAGCMLADAEKPPLLPLMGVTPVEEFHVVPSFFLFKQILKWTSITDEGYDNGFGAEGENGCNVTRALVGDQRVTWELLLPMRSAYWVISFQIVVRELMIS